MLRLVFDADQVQTSSEEDKALRPLQEEIRAEALFLEKVHGQNPYSSFLNKHGELPNRLTAGAIGRMMGTRVRAADGSLQPALSNKEKLRRREINADRRAWKANFSNLHRIKTAISLIALCKEDPANLVENRAFAETISRDELDFALGWLERFAKDYFDEPSAGTTDASTYGTGC